MSVNKEDIVEVLEESIDKLEMVIKESKYDPYSRVYIVRNDLKELRKSLTN